MKIYLKIGILIAIGIVTFSCENELEINSISNASVDSFFQTETDIEQAVVAAYDELQNEGQYGINFMILTEIRADDAFVESPTNNEGEYGDVDFFRVSPNNSRIEATWESCYRGISRCNIVLNRITDIEMDGTLKSTRIGELKFLRALTYFNLVRLWGDVPLVLEETTDPFDFFKVGRNATSEVYAQIIADLTDAISVLPNTSDAGRANKAAAQATLGKVHLTQGSWSEAASVLNSVSGYSLQEDFQNNFGIANQNGKESIFEVQFVGGNGSILNNSPGSVTIGEGSPFPNQVAPGLLPADVLGVGVQRGENLPSNDLYDSFESGDLRRDISIGVLENGTKYARKLIDTPVFENDSDLNVIVIRYADVLLMEAEALNEVAYVSDGAAFDLLNEIRNRAGLISLTATDLGDQASFRAAVLEERRHEFVSENQRWFDLTRTGRAIAIMNASTSAFSVSDFQLIYPIPLSALDAINDPSIFGQNPGY